MLRARLTDFRELAAREITWFDLWHKSLGFDTLRSRNLQAKFRSGGWRTMHCRKSCMLSHVSLCIIPIVRPANRPTKWQKYVALERECGVWSMIYSDCSLNWERNDQHPPQWKYNICPRSTTGVWVIGKFSRYSMAVAFNDNWHARYWLFVLQSTSPHHQVQTC